MNKILEPFVKEINYLFHSGVNLDITKFNLVKAKFISCSLLGDNLGLNVSLGFAKGFNANYNCRICELKKEICQKTTKEKQIVLNKENKFCINQYGVDELSILEELTK